MIIERRCCNELFIWRKKISRGGRKEGRKLDEGARIGAIITRLQHYEWERAGTEQKSVDTLDTHPTFHPTRNHRANTAWYCNLLGRALRFRLARLLYSVYSCALRPLVVVKPRFNYENHWGPLLPKNGERNHLSIVRKVDIDSPNLSFDANWKLIFQIG